MVHTPPFPKAPTPSPTSFVDEIKAYTPSTPTPPNPQPLSLPLSSLYKPAPEGYKRCSPVHSSGYCCLPYIYNNKGIYSLCKFTIALSNVQETMYRIYQSIMYSAHTIYSYHVLAAVGRFVHPLFSLVNLGKFQTPLYIL